MTREQLLMSSAADYMGDDQLAFFKALMGCLLEECQARISNGVKALSELEKATDEIDLASVEEDRQAILRILDRDRQNFPRLHKAMQRIDDRSFGYCEELGEPIGIQRLLARPATTLCIEAKYYQEMRKKHLKMA